MEENTLENKSKEWNSLILKCDEYGELSLKTWNELAQQTKDIIEKDMDEIVVDRKEIEKAENAEIDKDGERTGYWSYLEYEHDEELINMALKDEIINEDIDMDGKTIESDDIDYTNLDVDEKDDKDIDEEVDIDDELEFELE